MKTDNDPGTARQTAILDAANAIFLRYGFRKTSMDDVARAVGISRQALYLHFQNKDALFRAMVAHTLEGMRVRASAALVREDLNLEDQILGAFEAIHGSNVGVEHLDELIATSAALLGPVFRKVEDAIISEVAHTLCAAGIDVRWGMAATTLAEHLAATSDGTKRKATTPAEYLERMRIAVRLVCRGAPPARLRR